MDIKLTTDYNFEECKNILLSKVDQSFMFGELRISLKGTTLKVRKRVFNAFTKIFIGKFSKEGSKTIITGHFKIDKGPLVFQAFMIIVFLVLLIFMSISLFTNPISLNVIPNIILAMAMIAFVIIFSNYLKKKGKKDEIFIVNRIKDLLNVY